MGDDVGKKVRFILGLAMPVVVVGILTVTAVLQAVRFQDWGFIGSAIVMSVLLLGPFLIYFFTLRTVEFSIVIGVLLVAAAGYSVVDMLNASDKGSSTAGLALLWVPLVGYPVVAVGAFLDRLSR